MRVAPPTRAVSCESGWALAALDIFPRCVICDLYVTLRGGDRAGQLLGHLLEHCDEHSNPWGLVRLDADASGVRFAPLVAFLRGRVTCDQLSPIDRINYFYTWLIVQERSGAAASRNALLSLIPSILCPAQSWGADDFL